MMATPEKKKKKIGSKEHDSSKYIDTEPTLDEAAKGTAVVAWGRMNPITSGHEKLVKKVITVAKAEKGMPHIFLTHSYDAKKNPLSYENKIKYAQKAFGTIVKKSNAKTIFQLMKQLETRFNRVILVAGSDRVTEFDTTLNKYNGKEYKFDEIKVVSAGQRDEEADDVSGISGTKMRGYAATDIKKFTTNLPKRLKGDAEDIASLVRKGMNMSESEEVIIDDMETLEEARILTRAQRRKLGLRMKKNRHKMKLSRERAKRRMASMETLKKRAKKAARNILKMKFAKNRRYAELSAGEKEQVDKRIAKVSKNRLASLERKLLPKIKKAERDRKQSMAAGGSKKESLDLNSRFEMFVEDYYKGVPKDKKDDREAHFKRKAEKPGDGPDKDSNYKPAPGDFKDGKRVKTKVSQHTKNYKKMYGESEEWVCGNCHCEPCMCESDNLNEGLWGKYTLKKRPHMLMDQQGRVKFDKRFKMYKKNEDLNIESLMSLTEDLALDLNEDPTASLKKKAEKTGMPMGILRKVYNRGVAAWKSGHRPGTTPEQWGHARVNSFVTKSSGTWGKADSDLAAKVRKEDVAIYEDLAADIRREKEKQARNKARTATANTEIDRNKATDKLHKMGLNRSMDRAKHYDARMKLSGLRKEDVAIDEAVYRVQIDGEGLATVNARTEKEAHQKARRKLGIGTVRSRLGKSFDPKAKITKVKEDLDEAATPQMKKAAASIEAYAKKHGGFDKPDFMKAAKMLSSGNAGSNFVKFVDYLDTEPREWLILDLAKTMGKQTVEKMFKVKIREEAESKPESKPKKKLKDMRKADKSWGKSDAFDFADVDEESGAGEEGTDKLVKRYKKDTPNCSD